MKKISKITIIGIIYILISISHVFASTAEIEIKASSTDVKVGDTVTITVSLNSEIGIEGFDSALQYDKSKLKLTNSGKISTDKFVDLSGEDEKTGEYRMTLLRNTTQDILVDPNLATLEFEVLKGCSKNETIKISEIALVDSNENLIDIEDKEIKLNVIDGGNFLSNNKFVILFLIAISAIVIIIVIKKIIANKKKNNKHKNR